LKERRPVERQEGADTADGEGHNDAEGKGDARRDETQAVVHSPHRETVEALACLLRHLAK